MKLDEALLAQLRVLIRDETRSEIERYLSPTFLQLVTRGSEEMVKILDAVNSMDDRFEDLDLRLKIVEASVRDLQQVRVEES